MDKRFLRTEQKTSGESFKTLKIESIDLSTATKWKIASAKNLKGMPNQFSKERISSKNVDFSGTLPLHSSIQLVLRILSVCLPSPFCLPFSVRRLFRILPSKNIIKLHA